MTESPSGGLPLGFLVLSNHTEETLQAGIQDLKALMPGPKAFGGRGVEVGPQVILTDDDKSEINSLKKAWPTSTLLLCQWHVMQVNLWVIPRIDIYDPHPCLVNCPPR